ncbi:MAG: hypothetical protein RI842_10780, partial [Schleiferiaceae bacterium]|nr:hypothetical protein [Schleiferiaceae bacterium]
MKKLLLLSGFLLTSLLYGQGSFNIFGPQTVCSGEEYLYEFNGTGQPGTYVWTVLSGGYLASTMQTQAVVNWTTPGGHQLKVVFYDQQGNALDSGLTEVTVQPPPSVEITTNTNFGCDSRIKDEEPPVDNTGEKCFIACASSEAVYTATAIPAIPRAIASASAFTA